MPRTVVWIQQEQQDWMNTQTWKVWLGIIWWLLNVTAVEKLYRKQHHL